MTSEVQAAAPRPVDRSATMRERTSAGGNASTTGVPAACPGASPMVLTSVSRTIGERGEMKLSYHAALGFSAEEGEPKHSSRRSIP